MSCPKFFVVARVVGRDGALPLVQRLVHLCNVSATETLGDTYYWGQDLDGEPDTLWGLEGYTHPVGFFLGHVSTDIFKREMALVDADQLLRHEQGLASRDYDLHHYDWAGGWLKRGDDPDRDSKTSHVVVYHFWAVDKDCRAELMTALGNFATETKDSQGPSGTLQSCAVLKECRDETMTTLWLRTKTAEDFNLLHSSERFQALLASVKPIVARTEIHQSKAFNGHLDLKPAPS
ncbi:hypothetical protein T310_7923 [Rasamsonia emersonii CBS 393.64]|uniref:ABM domain-containing protein n=1 Tax=Rasamsonia emersonii (strain ATCC 16479 / CBS 393.64 / IMI 116815) TaxID=1408163 RepID=A0A0F4YKL6_RASE3|nr:hypothetical protein T310_7923 [Rasamsonia emersonii CBS 393.64]KKA18128.1 hypothetical protein T310_7923 [Rasamsonia emersonii CBS 393.64]